jgi:hypothetical protein
MEYGENPNKIANQVSRKDVIDCRTPLKGEYKNGTKQKECGFVINTSQDGNRAYKLSADSPKERDDWVEFMNKWINGQFLPKEIREEEIEKKKKEEVNLFQIDSDNESVKSSKTNDTSFSKSNVVLEEDFDDEEETEVKSVKSDSKGNNNEYTVVNKNTNDGSGSDEEDQEDFLEPYNSTIIQDDEDNFVLIEEVPIELKTSSIGPKIDLESRLFYTEKEILDVINEIEETQINLQKKLKKVEKDCKY